MQYIRNFALLALLFCAASNLVFSQSVSPELIEELKQDRRGPYKDIKWFCEDGTVREARDPCPEPMEGVQHARFKDNIVRISERDHIFLDQILTGTEKNDFWDAEHQNSRVKQYQITNYLFSVDDGWILEKAKNYRGAKQIEDEQKWGQEFLEWVVSNNQRLRENYLLIRMAAEDIPHGEDNRVSQRVRAYSKLLADVDPSFMNVRIKIHNNPSESDISSTSEWAKNKSLSDKSKEYYDLLMENLDLMYEPFDVAEIKKYANYLPKESSLKQALEAYTDLVTGAPKQLRAIETSMILRRIREEIYQTKWSEARVKMIDLSNHLEDVLMKDINALDTNELSDIRDNLCYLSDALFGAGYLEEWELEKVRHDMDWMSGEGVRLADLGEYKYAANKMVQWSTQMVQSLYAPEISTYHTFEPMVDGFTDDKIRSSIILPTGFTVERLNKLFNATIKSTSTIMGKTDLTGVQGLNPGIAKGKLVVIDQAVEDMDLNSEVIYAFDRPPADLKPVAGILNVKEGNPVSHVQLLARNLAIPNGLISSEVLNGLKKYDGKEVFYAVSPKGTIVVKLAEDMTKEEQKLYKAKQQERKRTKISTEKLVFDPDSLLNLRDIGSEVSGKWCGPKAANLGQLKEMFPENVVEGIVIPFGVFRDHMHQNIPNRSKSYWSVLQEIFEEEARNRAEGKSQQAIERATIGRLEELRKLIVEMPLKESLVGNIEEQFKKIFGKKMGAIPVFLRSDTNMEDLPEFTGAGLNLTLFNVLDREEILNGIRKVWASPYTARSYQWRQQYLENPLDVYPSILIIPSVNVDRSGVIITKGVTRGGDDDISISFSRGVGGAVDGQAAESYIIRKNGYHELINPGRETKYRVIPPTGGSTYSFASFTEPVLNYHQLETLKNMANEISNKMDKVTGDSGPYDIELGIKDDKIWLFQVRPFVENNAAQGSEYLKSLDPFIEELVLRLDN